MVRIDLNKHYQLIFIANKSASNLGFKSYFSNAADHRYLLILKYSINSSTFARFPIASNGSLPSRSSFISFEIRISFHHSSSSIHSVVMPSGNANNNMLNPAIYYHKPLANGFSRFKHQTYNIIVADRTTGQPMGCR